MYKHNNNNGVIPKRLLSSLESLDILVTAYKLLLKAVLLNIFRIVSKSLAVE